jgi:hypothetical protein
MQDQWITEEIKKVIKKFLDSNKNEKTTYQKIVGHSKGSFKRYIYSHEHPHQKIKEISNKPSYDVP